MDSDHDDDVEEVADMTTTKNDPQGWTVQIGTRQFPEPVSFDDLSLTVFKRTVLIPWFDRVAVHGDDEA